MQRAQTIADLVSKLRDAHQGGWQYLEVKQMSEILARHREKARLAVREYRILKQTILAESDPIEKLYLGYEGMFLRDHLRDALRLYVLVNRDFHEAYGSYMEDAKNPGPLITPLAVELLEPKAEMRPEPRLVANTAKKPASRRNAA